MTLASQIPLINNACNEILNAGTKLYVRILNNCEAEAPVDTLTVDTVTVIGDESIDLTSSNTTPGTFLRAGTVLTFPSGTVVTTEAVTVTTGTTVATEVQTAAIAASDTTENQGLLQLLSPTNIPMNIESTTVSRTDLNSIQGSDVKTLNKTSNQIQCIASADDEALWAHVFPAANSIRDVYVVIPYNTTQVTFGRALLSNYTHDGATEEIVRPQFQLMFQGDDYRNTTAWAYIQNEDGTLDTAQQAVVNQVMRRAGLAEFA